MLFTLKFMTSRDVQNNIEDMSVFKTQYIGVQSTQWSYMNQPLH
jgi:hypothetical protein